MTPKTIALAAFCAFVILVVNVAISFGVVAVSLASKLVGSIAGVFFAQPSNT